MLVVIEKFNEVIAMLEQDALPSYERSDLGPALNFTSVPPMLESIRRDLVAGSLMNEADFPDNHVTTVVNGFPAFGDALHNIRTWQPAQADANNANTHTHLVKTVQGMRDSVAQHIRSYLRPDLGDIPPSLREAAELYNQALTSTQEIERIIADYQTASIQQANLEVSSYYKTAADEHQRAAKRFLVAASLVATSLIAGVVVLFFTHPATVNTVAETIRAITGRTLLLLIAAAGLAFCTRNYRVNKHLEVTNRTRYNALMTASKYIAGVTEDARNLVVAELVRSIFSPGDTGYMNTDREQTVVENAGSLAGLLAAGGKKG